MELILTDVFAFGYTLFFIALLELYWLLVVSIFSCGQNLKIIKSKGWMWEAFRLI